MPDLGLLLAPGTGVLLAAGAVSGIGLGIAGFGAALVFLPLAMIHLPPVEAVTVFTIAALGTLATSAPRHAAAADRRTTVSILACGALGMVVGLPILVSAEPYLLRTAVCVLGVATVVALGMGLRYRLPDGRWSRALLGTLAGTSWGAFGMAAPVVALVRLGCRGEPRGTREGVALALPMLNGLMLALLAGGGLLTERAVLLGLLALPVLTAGTLLGQALRRRRADLWQAAALVAAALAAMTGLPALV
ncbi:sulfite exporter TauE/SafE [Hasllibacter halocynthiae]|uniref:Probable membrane transporter protein n=1 Tax=Hasllibacter halocynthiae TaxID=595589 RepID=A0A2T0X910_9RHOB|nr:sulfite exporter TauE/SafE family protein [Hasllibacter halocynthiae]PRY95409.1 sulfite exporter TauE/SafE [Hasllibacter halocynthiae]